MNSKALAFLILMIFLFGCKSREEKTLNKTPHGDFTMGSALLMTTIEHLPIGMLDQQLTAGFEESPYLAPYQKGTQLFEPLENMVSDRGIIYTTKHRRIHGYPEFIVEFFRDTCYSVFFMDTTKNIDHIKKTVELFDSLCGKGRYSHRDFYWDSTTDMVSIQRNVDDYVWSLKNSTIALQHHQPEHYYWIAITDSGKWKKVWKPRRY